MSEQFRRKTPEEILRSIIKIQQGHLKIIVGAVSGSGKTYQMLLEGQSLKKHGIDVVVGVMNGADHPQTLQQVGELEVIPAITWKKNGVEQQDLDVAGLIKRDPEVVLVDDLAHRNRPDSPRATRLDDVNELLQHNIGVITTINIYELSGVREVAEKIMGVPVQVDNCVPEDTLAMADEVKLLDVTPEVILKRIQEGRIQTHPDDKRARDKLFHRDNLAILRELALRVVAGEVNEDLDEYREKHGIRGPSGVTERILVAVQYHWNGSILVRRGQQIAKRVGGRLFVVCFRPSHRRITKEEDTFRHSIMKLVDKVDGEFAERTYVRESEVAQEIARYATEKSITRIVMGHSKRSRWEELKHGSIVNKLLRKTRNVDILIVADRSDQEGKRVLPTRSIKRKLNPYRRLTREEVEQAIGRVKRGTLKVYIGAAPGVGKTYTMLRDANGLKKQGIDVVIGLLETHGRQETIDQVGDLEIIPRRQMTYKDVVLEEMDTEAILKRNPEVVLIDELAHTNAPGSRNEKRYQDVEQIINAGISVISTMNIQHVESLNDSVEQITGIKVRDTVPDQILHLADEVELIDISPKALRERIREGSVYSLNQVNHALNHFFKTGNLIALRELALREVADDVDERLEAGERKRNLRGPWRQEEVIFVCVTLRPESERLIRRGFRIAYRLKAAWFAAYVKNTRPLSAEEEQQLSQLKALTERLGGVFEVYEAADHRQVFRELVHQMNDKHATQVILGHSAQTRWEELSKGSVVTRLLQEIRHMDVLVVSDPSYTFSM